MGASPSAPFDLFDDKLPMRIGALGAGYYLGGRLLLDSAPELIETAAVAVSPFAGKLAAGYVSKDLLSNGDIISAVAPATTSFAFQRDPMRAGLAAAVAFGTCKL